MKHRPIEDFIIFKEEKEHLQIKKKNPDNQPASFPGSNQAPKQSEKIE